MRVNCDSRVDRPADDDVDVADPPVIDIGMLRDFACAALYLERRPREIDTPQQAHAEPVPGDRPLLEPVAEMPRLMVEDARNLRPRNPCGSGRFEDVVSLIRIENPELVSEDGLIVDDRVHPSEHVVDDVDLSAKMRVPCKSRIVDLQSGR